MGHHTKTGTGGHDAEAVSPAQVLVFATATAALLLASLWSDLALGASFCLALALIGLPVAPWLSVVFLALLVGWPGLMSEYPATVAGFRLYGADGLAYFLAAAAAFWLWHKCPLSDRPPPWTRPERVLAVLTLAFAAYGLVPALYGFAVQHHALRDVLGDYRRLHLYALALLIPLALPLRSRHLALVEPALVAAFCVALLTGLYRLWTGHSYDPEYFTQLEYHRRWLSTAEVVALETAIAYVAVALSVRRRLWHVLPLLGLGGASAALLFISGWRLAVLFIAGAPLLAYGLSLRARKRSLLGLVGGVLVMVLVAAVAAAVLTFGFAEHAAEHAGRLSDRFRNLTIEDARAFAWPAALRTFAEHPVTGVGLGHQLFHYFRTSEGTWLGRVMTTHNYPLDVLYQSGLPAFVLFLATHGLFNIRFLRGMGAIAAQRLPAALALYVGYLCNLATHSIEPTLAGGMVALYLSMGFATRLLRPPREVEGRRDVRDRGPM